MRGDSRQANSDCSGVPEVLKSYEDISSGNPFAELACLSSRGLGGSDAAMEAVSKALPALGYADEGAFLIDCSFALVSGTRGRDEGAYERIRLCLETVDPAAVLALDEGCLPLVRRLANSHALAVSKLCTYMGRKYLVLQDFSAALMCADKKREDWHAMRGLARTRL